MTKKKKQIFFFKVEHKYKFMFANYIINEFIFEFNFDAPVKIKYKFMFANYVIKNFIFDVSIKIINIKLNCDTFLRIINTNDSNFCINYFKILINVLY